MRNVANKIFGLAAAGAMAMTPMAAFSQAAPANQNITPVAASVQPVAFATFDDTDQTPDFVRTGAAMASRDKVAIVVFSGNRDLQREAYQAALQLRDEGVPLALILGPSLDPSNSSAAIQVYARSVPVYEGYGAVIGVDNIDHLRAETLRGARSAYQRHFSREIATLALAQD